MPGLFVVTVFLVLVIVTISLGVRIVPQGSKHVVQRLGKYHKTLAPGLNIIIPYIDTVAEGLVGSGLEISVTGDIIRPWPDLYA